MITVGLISDTHDRLAPEALEALEDCDHIIHAGDLTNPDVLAELETIAPVSVARGNCDWGYWAQSLPATVTKKFENIQIQVIHNLNHLDLLPDTDIVVYGHTHIFRQRFEGNVLFINPGSASEPRDGQKPSVARIIINGDKYALEHSSWKQERRMY